MTSLSGTKERSVTSRSRKYGVPDTSPTKSASFSPETWYRKAYEESSRGGSRPAPEGAGSMPSSAGTPSPGSGMSSPGSFSGSSGPVSPGIGTGSPGSLGGSPGFGTGSPASGSGSSPGSERGGWCENCNARLVALFFSITMRCHQCLGVDISLEFAPGSTVPNSSRRAWNERDSRCDVCSTHLNQLKQEAVHMVLTLDHWDLSPTSSPTALLGRFALQGPQGSAALPGAPLAPPGSGHRLGSKPSSLGLGGASDRRSASPSQGKASGSQQPPGSGGNSHGNSSSGSGAVLSTAALQAHQHLTRTSGGVTLYPYQISQMISEASREEEMTEAALNRHNTHSPSHVHTSSHSNTNSPSHTPPVTTAAPATATSTAASFFVRAAQKLNLASKKKKQKSTAPVIAPVTSSSSPACDPALFPTNFSSALSVAPPPAPPCLLRAANKIKDTPGLGKSDAAESSSFLKVDPRKKQITIMEPSANQGTSKRAGANQVPPKIFAFDAAFPHDASQDDSLQTLGIIPCSISWLFKLINERKEKTGARFSVRVSAVEEPGTDTWELKVVLVLQNQSELRAPTPEKAAWFLDAAIAARHSSQRGDTAKEKEEEEEEEQHRNSHMLFTLHIYQYRMEKTGKGGSK
ncbi:hypothetical protein NHX12_005789 [Muraenolepis orangiensis]|uniref:Kinesin motor domain-containing protein n=1 Tax=Muraenolepis orangiensis TaxID=630683 RepID=A0A9Q0ICA8_9TELE|nr:hypothetical protein NHX12_005789 [Muraenolepis orangiensis]